MQEAILIILQVCFKEEWVSLYTDLLSENFLYLCWQKKLKFPVKLGG